MVQTHASHAVVRDRQEVRYTYVQSGETRSRTISFFCPGASYLFDKPYLHYSTMVMLGHQSDIVHIQYAYGKENAAFEKLSMPEKSQWMQEDVHAVVSKILAEHPYEKVFFLGKSIGTMPIVEGLLPDPEHEKAVAILLTPIVTSSPFAAHLLETTQPIYLAIGTADPFYQKPLIERLQRTKPNVQLQVIPNANHALEIGWDLHASLTTLQLVMGDMNDFVFRQLSRSLA